MARILCALCFMPVLEGLHDTRAGLLFFRERARQPELDWRIMHKEWRQMNYS